MKNTQQSQKDFAERNAGKKARHKEMPQLQGTIFGYCDNYVWIKFDQVVKGYSHFQNVMLNHDVISISEISPNDRVVGIRADHLIILCEPPQVVKGKLYDHMGFPIEPETAGK